MCNGLVGYPDTAVARQEQQKGHEVFRNTMKMQTVKTVQDNEFNKIYNNSFSRCRSRFDEYAKVNLTSRERK